MAKISLHLAQECEAEIRKKAAEINELLARARKIGVMVNVEVLQGSYLLDGRETGDFVALSCLVRPDQIEVK